MPPIPFSLDLRSALRGLARDRAFTAFSVLALALGLGLNGALMVLSRTFLLRPAPVARPETLLEVKDVFKDSLGIEARGSTSAYEALRELPVFAGSALADDPITKNWNHPNGSEPLQVMEVGHEYLPLLGIQPVLGRGFQPGEGGTGPAQRLAVISHDFWRTRLGARLDAIGSLVSLEGQAHTVVGVLPRGFQGHALDQTADILVPIQYSVMPPSSKVRILATVLVRLKEGTSLVQARSALASLAWGGDMHLELHPYHPIPVPMQTRLTRGLAGLHGAALLILGIGLANVLALQTARLHRRRPELAMRSALGADGRQLFRLILVENAVLAGLAAAAALLLAALSAPFLDAIQALLPYPPKVQLSFGPVPAAVTLGLSLLLGILMAALVFLQARRLELGSPLKEAGAQTSGTRIRGLLVAAQAALALVLLSSATLCLKDLRRQLDIPLGMDIQDRFLLECQPGKVGRKSSDLKPITPILRERLRAIPGVEGVALSHGGPVKGFSVAMVQPFGICLYLPASHDLTTLMGIRVTSGRALEPGDEGQGRILVNASFARKQWPDASPVGRRWSFQKQELEVVGVVPDILFGGPTSKSLPFVLRASDLKDPLGGQPLDHFTVKASGHASRLRPAILAAARAELKDIPFELRSLVEIRDEALAQPRQLFFLSAIMGALALLLSLCGLYGLAVHLAQSRRRELGIRVVLGAGPGRILGALARGSLLPVLPGLAAGGCLAMATSRMLVHQGEGFPTLDTPMLLWSCLLLAIAASVATLFPALRAVRVPPAQSLRME